MNINFVIHSFDSNFSGGVARVVAHLANLFHKNIDCQVRIYSLSPVQQPAFELHDGIELICLNVHKFATSHYKGVCKLFWIFEFYKIFNNLLLKNSSNNIWLTTSLPLNFLFCLLKNHYQNLIIIGCEHTSSGYQNSMYLKLLKKIILKKLNYIIALTKEDDDYYKILGLNSRLIPNPIDLPNKNLMNNRDYLIYVGRFSEEKQPLLALQIYHKSKLYKKGIIFRMFGIGNCDLLRKYINQNNLVDFVEIIIGEMNVDRIYGDAYGLIMTSKVEGLPMVLLEAISRNIPCVAFDCPYGPRNIIKNSKNGFLIPVGDTEKFVNVLKDGSLEVFHSLDISKSVSYYLEDNILNLWENLFDELPMNKKCI